MASLKSRIEKVRTNFRLTIGVAIFISIYSFYVEWRLEMSPDHKPLCDISDGISCTKAFKSEYGKAFGLTYLLNRPFTNQTNSLYGILFYTSLLLLDRLHPQAWDSYCKYMIIEDYAILMAIIVALLQLFMLAMSNFTSIYLAYILAFEVKSFCVVCVSTYFINISLLLNCYRKINLLKEMSIKKQKTEEEALAAYSESKKKDKTN
ncbi:hypothetical protein CHUAL_005748 [Chamberlinius hualienensis]